jgi:hypothetical protein
MKPEATDARPSGPSPRAAKEKYIDLLPINKARYPNHKYQTLSRYSECEFTKRFFVSNLRITVSRQVPMFSDLYPYGVLKIKYGVNELFVWAN